MLESIPNVIVIAFVLTTILTIILFFRSISRSTWSSKTKNTTYVLTVVWLGITAMLSYSLFFMQNLDSFPPRFFVGIAPAIFLIFYMTISKRGKALSDQLDLEDLTWISIVRIPVEFVLLYLFLNKGIPEEMTFEGRNFDILAGLTAPFIAYFGYRKRKFSKTIILAWNILSLGLLLNIIFHAAIAAPTPLQQIAFDQPNIAVLHFPFNWLPMFIVPVVLFTHFVSIRRLLFTMD